MSDRDRLSGTYRRALLGLGLLFTSPAPLRAAADGTIGADFLRLGVGAPSGMQDASGAVAQDATAIYWNPAGLAALGDPDAYMSYRVLPESMRYNFLGAVLPCFPQGPVSSAIGYGLQVLSQDPIERIDNAGNSAGRFSALDMAHTVAWASQWRQTRAGVSLRWIRQSIDNTSGSVFAGGFGLQQDVGKAGAVGLSVDNAGPRLRLGSESFALPMTGRVGGSYAFLQEDLLAAGDVTLPKGLPAQWHMGLAYRIFPPHHERFIRSGLSMTVRFGYTVETRDPDGPPGFTGGLSTEVGSFRVDLSYQPFGRLGDSVQAGIGYRFSGRSGRTARFRHD